MFDDSDDCYHQFSSIWSLRDAGDGEDAEGGGGLGDGGTVVSLAVPKPRHSCPVKPGSRVKL